MSIPDNVYNIHIDEHLEVAGARFNGSCSQVHRIAITEFSPPNPSGSRLPIGYIDDIEVRVGIVIPTDFPTIQAGVDAASLGDVVYVTSRVYFENVTISAKQNGIWLVGENVNTTVIDGRFAKAASYGISSVSCSNVTVYGFTVRFSAANGTQVCLNGSGNTITNNIIVSGLGDGISVSGSGNTVSNNVINSTLQCGIRVEGSNSTVTGNVVLSSLDTGIFLAASYSNLTDNVIQSSQVGINLSAGEGNLVRNNTIEANGIGLQCGIDVDGSLIYQNRFVGNNVQALDDGTSNSWDNGYPYTPENQTGGGNYWSDFNNCTDVYSGRSQNESANSNWPSPDGISDQPYQVSSSSTDHYPLFLIQRVAQNPKSEQIDSDKKAFDGSIDYGTSVTVTVTTLKFVKIANATLNVDFTNANATTHSNITMKVSDKNLTGVIPHQPFGTTVRYNVSVLAYRADWLSSTSYPIPFPYFVDDWTPPNISNVSWVPGGPNENQTITVYATATEPADASQVDKVYVSYLVNFTWWTAEMTKIVDGNYTAVVPRQPGNATMNFNVTAVDKAGNWAPPKNSTQYIKKLAQLSVGNVSGMSADPCSIDLGVVSGNQTYSTGFNVTNISGPRDDPLIWNITVAKGGPWLTSMKPLGGSVLGGQSIRVTVTVDTHYSTDSSVYVEELSVNATGIVPQWAVMITFTVRNIIIDKSWASSEAPSRCNVNTTEYFAFHAKWGNNCSDATGGSLRIKGSSFVQVNVTGWALFNYSSTVLANLTFGVEEVKFGSITSFAQTAPNCTTIWDRVKIVLTTANGYVEVGSNVDISWNGSYYELDKTLFEGLAIFNDSLTRDHVDEAWIGTSSIIDYKYPELTAFEGNSVHCIWEARAPTPRPWWEAFWPTNATTTVENQPANTSSQKLSAGAYNSWAVVIIAVTIGIGLLVTLLILVNSGKKPKSGSDKRKVVQPNRNINTNTSKH
jgi:parallel beta-helix repeat protein